MFNTFVKFDAKYIYYNYVDCEFTKCLRRERLFTPREDPFFRLTPKEIKDKYRFYPHTIMDICRLVQKELERPTKRSNPLTVQQVVCVSLYILAHGKYWNVIHNTHPPLEKSFRLRNFSVANISYYAKSKLRPLPASAAHVINSRTSSFCRRDVEGEGAPKSS